jgi:hypothetical protein
MLTHEYSYAYAAVDVLSDERDSLILLLVNTDCRQLFLNEVALLVFGLQGSQKAVAVANIWDACGRGRLETFHTFWLRRFICADNKL